MTKHTKSKIPFAPRTRRVVLLVAGLAVAGAFATRLTTHATAAESISKTAVVPPAPKVSVASVEEKLVTEYEEITGRVDATETVELRARVSGHMEAVRFQAGQIVQKGDVLFTIDPRYYRAQYDLAQARAEVAERESKRAEALLASKAISSEEADARRASAAETRAAFELARLDLEHTDVRAPITGRVSRALVTAGNLVSGSPGNATLLTTIVSIGDAYVYADLDESMMLRFNRLARENRLVLENGHIPVELQLADESGFPRRGYIESTDNRLDPATGSLVLRMVFPNADQALVPGLFARVRVPVSAPQRALLISERAIGTDQSQKFVLALSENNTVVYRTVKLGSEIDGKRIVRDGLHSGDKIVVNGLQRVRPGMTVAPELVADDVPLASSPRLASR
jgi:membrane fusion protein, multidrug efflux system